MAKMFSMCGLDCAACPAFIAHKTDDNALREKTAAEWSQQFHVEIKPADINCVGCTAEGQHIGYCGMCEIRGCAQGKGVKNCGWCADYSCAKTEAFFKMARLEFVEGNEQDAVAKLKRGGYVLVAPEFAEIRKLKMGSRIGIQAGSGMPGLRHSTRLIVSADSALRTGLGLTGLTGPSRASVNSTKWMMLASSSRPTQLDHCLPSPSLPRLRLMPGPPSTAGMPYSRATTEPCVIIPPTSITSPAADMKSGVQDGSVPGQTRISPGCKPAWRGSSTTRTGSASRPEASSAPPRFPTLVIDRR